MKTLRQRLQTGLLVSAATLSAQAGSFSSDFNSGLPAGATLYGTAVVEPTGGVGDSGCLKLTKASNSQSGSIVLDDLDGGQPIYGFDVSYDVLIGGGTATPADGMSLCVAPDLPNAAWGEQGTGSGLRFVFETYAGAAGPPPPPSIDVDVGGAKDITSKQTIASITTNGFVHVHICLNPDGSLNLDFRGQTLFTNFFIPQYQDLANAGVPVRFGIGARTGGLNENHFVDNLSISTFLLPMVGISQQPFSQKVLAGDDATFDVRVANTNGVTYQWYSNTVSIAGATSQTLVISNVQASASGSTYKVTATGPNNNVTSTVVTLTVINLTLPSTPQLAFNFNDGAVPPNTTNLGTALVDTTGGVTNSGCLKLTTSVNTQNGAFLISDPDAGAPVYGFTARFKALLGGGTVPPADGFAFAFGSDIPNDPTTNAPNRYEEGEGLGTGLRVTFDIYDNNGILGYVNVNAEAQPAPSVDVRYGGQVLATTQLPVSFMESGLNDDGTPAYTDVIIQLNTDGTLNVLYHGALLFDQLPIPFGSLSGGSFALAARTGGLNENIWMDNIELTTVTTPGALRITSQPANQLVLVGHAATFSLGLNNTNTVTYQWFRNTAPISGATGSSYTIPSVALADDGAVFKVQATQNATMLTSTQATLTVVNLTPPASPQFSFNFDNGLLPGGTGIYGNSSISPNGGVGDSGVLHLTDAINSQNGAFVVSNLVFNGAQVSGISVAFDLREGGGSSTPADGFSFNWAAGLTDGTVAGAEAGTGNGLSIAFRIFIGNGNKDNPPSPYIGVKYKGSFVATTQIPAAQLDTGSGYRTMLLRVDSNGKIYLTYGDMVIYIGLQLPNYTFIANSKFGFYGRTGGLNENQWLDNILIQATQSSGPLTIVTQPANFTAIAGSNATFTVALSNPNSATYQWQKNGADISGATAVSYITPPTTTGDSGALFRVKANGPSGNATSSNAVLTVVGPITISNPIISYDFNDGMVPLGTTLNGNAASITLDGGVTNSGVLHLTDNVTNQSGTFIIPDPNTNAPVKAFTAYFALMMGGGTIPPADGVSFSWASSNDVPANLVVSEGGVGNDLRVIFDLYNGANPYFGVTWRNTPLVTTYVPYTAMEIGTNFGDTYIRVNANGTVDVQYNGMVLFNQVPLPGYAAIAGDEFVFGARTGGLSENQWVDNVEIATTTGLAPVRISFTLTGNSLRLTWPGTGLKLQSTSSLNQPVTRTDVPGASSPYTVPATNAAQFYLLAP